MNTQKNTISMSKEFFNALMHEVRHPLMSVLNLRSMIDDSALSKDDKIFLHDTEQGVENLGGKLKIMIDGFEWEYGGKILEKKKCTLENLLQKIQNDPRLKGQKFAIKIASGLKKIELEVDLDAVAWAVAELVHNGLFFCKKTPNVTLEITQGKGGLVFQISDNGPGIEKLYWEKVFELLFVISQSRHLSECGLGVGLTKARGIARMHGGEVKIVESGMGRGTVFQLTTGN